MQSEFFKQEKKVRRTLNILVAIIIVLIIAIVAVAACKFSSCNDNTTNPTVTDAPATNAASQPATDTPTDIPAETPAVSEQPTEPPAGGGVDANGLAYAPTEGTMEDVYARIEQLKLLPSDATIILIDVGHGGFDPGSIGVETNVKESELNYQVAKLVAQMLGEKGYYVLMTRMGEYALAENKKADMNARKQIMKLDIFDASVSIHMNSFPSDRSVQGVRLYKYQTGTDGERLAETILDSIIAATGQKRRATVADDLMVVREPVAPAALVECGFISNHDEELLLQSSEYQVVFAQAVADGIESFINAQRSGN